MTKITAIFNFKKTAFCEGATDMSELVKALKLTCFKVFHLLQIHYAFFQITFAHIIFLMNT